MVKIDIKNTGLCLFSRRVGWRRSRVHISRPGGVYEKTRFRKNRKIFGKLVFCQCRDSKSIYTIYILVRPC